MKYEVTIKYVGFTTYLVDAPDPRQAETKGVEAYENDEDGTFPAYDNECITGVVVKKEGL